VSCLAGPTRHPSIVVLLTQVTKPTQQIGDHTRDKVSNSTLFGLREHFFLINLSCRYQNQPILTCQRKNFELEEDNFTQKNFPRCVSESARIFHSTDAHSAHCVPYKILFIAHCAPTVHMSTL
jgi:hypothetical protein